jgi:hypothetical protein
MTDNDNNKDITALHAAMLCLKIRWLLTDKEMNIAVANRELACLGQWRCDYENAANVIDREIQPIMEELERLTRSGDGLKEGVSRMSDTTNDLEQRDADARRYRWLKSAGCYWVEIQSQPSGDYIFQGHAYHDRVGNRHMDDAIDKVIAKQKEGGIK